MRLENHNTNKNQLHDIETLLLNENSCSNLFYTSNKSTRKLEEMIDVINFTLFDFELIYERYKDSAFINILIDIISYLKSAKCTLNRESLNNVIDLNVCQTTFMMAIYAAMRAINHLLKQKDTSILNLNEDLSNMMQSLQLSI